MIIGSAAAGTLYKLDLISEKQRAIACNIANMDTPHYVRKDVSFSQYLGGQDGSIEPAISIKMGPSPVTVNPSSGKVDPAFELAEMKKVQILYTEAARRMTSLISEMKQAVSMGSGG